MFPYSASRRTVSPASAAVCSPPRRTLGARRTTHARSRRRASSSVARARAARGVLVDRLEHPVALAVEDDEALVDERLQRVEVGAAHLLGRLERAAAGEDRERGEEAAAPPRRAARTTSRAWRAASAGAGRRRGRRCSRSSRCAEPLEDLRRARARSCAPRRARPRAAAVEPRGTARRSRPRARARERGQNSATASPAGERRQAVLALGLHLQALARGDEQRQPRAGGEQRREPRRRVDDLLHVVEHEQQPPLADVLGEAVLRAERAARSSRARTPASRRPARSTQKTPAGNDSARATAAASIASRVLPAPPGPVSVTSRAPPSIQRAHLGELALPADERARRPRQVRVRDRRERREARRRRAGRARRRRRRP